MALVFLFSACSNEEPVVINDQLGVDAGVVLRSAQAVDNQLIRFVECREGVFTRLENANNINLGTSEPEFVILKDGQIDQAGYVLAIWVPEGSTLTWAAVKAAVEAKATINAAWWLEANASNVTFFSGTKQFGNHTFGVTPNEYWWFASKSGDRISNTIWIGNFCCVLDVSEYVALEDGINTILSNPCAIITEEFTNLITTINEFNVCNQTGFDNLVKELVDLIENVEITPIDKSEIERLFAKARTRDIECNNLEEIWNLLISADQYTDCTGQQEIDNLVIRIEALIDGLLTECPPPPPSVGPSYGTVTATNAGNVPAILAGLNPKSGNPYYGDKKIADTPFIVPNSNHFVFAQFTRGELAAGVALEFLVGNKFEVVGTGSAKLVGGNIEVTIDKFANGSFGVIAFNKLPVFNNGNIHAQKEADLKKAGAVTGFNHDNKLVVPCPAGDTIYLYIHCGTLQFFL